MSGHCPSQASKILFPALYQPRRRRVKDAALRQGAMFMVSVWNDAVFRQEDQVDGADSQDIHGPTYWRAVAARNAFYKHCPPTMAKIPRTNLVGFRLARFTLSLDKGEWEPRSVHETKVFSNVPRSS